MDSSYTSPTTKPLFRATQIIWYICALIEIILAFRFFLRFAGANPIAPFTNFIYIISRPFMLPFVAVFRPTYIEGNVFEWTTVLAVIVYFIIAWGITSLLAMGKTVSTPEAAAKLEDNQ